MPLLPESRNQSISVRRGSGRGGYTIIELLIVVIIIGVLAAAALAKYQDFAESARRKSCLGHLASIEGGLALWETTNDAFAENVKCAFGFTPRTGMLTDTALTPTLLVVGDLGSVAALADVQPVVGGPAAFTNKTNYGPLVGLIRDDRIWVCPSAVGRFYGGEIQNVSDDYLDGKGGGVGGAVRGAPIGLGGRYFCAISSVGNRSLAASMTNGGFPPGWIANSSTAYSAMIPAPVVQPPFQIAVCGCYGTFGDGQGTSNVPGTGVTNLGGPVGPDGSTLSRHSSRW